MTQNKTIAVNRKAKHHYFIEKQLEAGIVLQGWEVKSLRAGRTQIDQSYLLLKDNDVYLIGALITPLPTTSLSQREPPNASRTRKLLLKRQEINKLIGLVKQKGYTLIPLEFYWKAAHIKLTIGLAKGKKQHDKRATEKEKSWQLDKARLAKQLKG